MQLLRLVRHAFGTPIFVAGALRLASSQSAAAPNDLESAAPDCNGLRPMRVVGGHAGLYETACEVFKPVSNDRRGAREVAFYDALREPGNEQLRGFTPACFGTLVDADVAAFSPFCGDAPVTYLRLENLTRGMHRPSVMDLKMGVQAWDEDAPPEKVVKEASKFQPQQAVGFRLTGMRVWKDYGGEAYYLEHGRDFGYSLGQATLHRGFAEFLHDGSRVRSEVIAPFLERLLKIRAWMSQQSTHRFYGSSLLFVYDAGTPSDAPRVDIRMIDFAHVWPIPRPTAAAASASGSESRAGGPGIVECESLRDTGYLHGLEHVIGYLLQVLRDYDPAAAEACDRAYVRHRHQYAYSLPLPHQNLGSDCVCGHFHHTTVAGAAAAAAYAMPARAPPFNKFFE